MPSPQAGGLPVLGESKAKAGTVVLSEWFPRLRFGAASVPGAVVRVEDMNERWGVRKVNVLV